MPFGIYALRRLMLIDVLRHECPPARGSHLMRFGIKCSSRPSSYFGPAVDLVMRGSAHKVCSFLRAVMYIGPRARRRPQSCNMRCLRRPRLLCALGTHAIWFDPLRHTFLPLHLRNFHQTVMRGGPRHPRWRLEQHHQYLNSERLPTTCCHAEPAHNQILDLLNCH